MIRHFRGTSRFRFRMLSPRPLHDDEHYTVMDRSEKGRERKGGLSRLVVDLSPRIIDLSSHNICHV